MRDSMAENQAKMMEMQRQMALKQRETQLATEFAKAKDRFAFYTGFYCTLLCAGMAGSLKMRNPAIFFGPAIPTTWAMAYQYDFVYGNKLERIMAETNRLLIEEPERFAPPSSSLMLPNPDYYVTSVLPERYERNAKLKTQEPGYHAKTKAAQ